MEYINYKQRIGNLTLLKSTCSTQLKSSTLYAYMKASLEIRLVMSVCACVNLTKLRTSSQPIMCTLVLFVGPHHKIIALFSALMTHSLP